MPLGKYAPMKYDIVLMRYELVHITISRMLLYIRRHLGSHLTAHRSRYKVVAFGTCSCTMVFVFRHMDIRTPARSDAHCPSFISFCGRCGWGPSEPLLPPSQLDP